jgi:S1-C subfamily serine protease
MAGGGDWILSRAQRAFGGRPISEAVAGVRQIIGPGKFPPGQEEAEEALYNLRNGIEPSPRQLAALELMIRLMRPAVYSRQGVLEPLPDFNEYAPGTVERWDRFRGLVSPRLYSIGRIDRKGGESLGTGFVVAPGLLATNRHVVEALSIGVNKLEEGQGVVLFGQERGTIETEDPVPIVAVAAVHPTLDMALLSIRDPRDDRPSLELETDPVGEGLAVAAIGYPFEDSRSPLFADAIYHKDYGNKRAAPGELLERSDATVLYHDCSTLGGNSGSPLFSQETARVVGLHSSGLFTYRNEAVAAAQLGEFVAAHP